MMGQATIGELAGLSEAMQRIREELDCIARSDAKVLIAGESGVGKEMIARLIHDRGPRSNGPSATLNCDGVPDEMLRSELSGIADGLCQSQPGTLFLQNIGEIGPSMQASLVRFLASSGVRTIASTNCDLYQKVVSGLFREDLYYQLNIIHIAVPPLRDRKNDVRFLVDEFVRNVSQVRQSPQPRFLDETLNALLDYSWPGNVSELKNVIEYLVVCAQSGIVQPIDLPMKIRQSRRVSSRRELKAG